LAITWSTEGPPFQPKYMPPEPSSRVKVMSSISFEPVHSNGRPLVCGAPTPTSSILMPDSTTSFFW
jgi:hypothetical protein